MTSRSAKSSIRLLSPTISADRRRAIKYLIGIILVFNSEELGVVDAIECGFEIRLEWVSLIDKERSMNG